MSELGFLIDASIWRWDCENEFCVKKSKNNATAGTSLETCKLVCGQYGTLWPVPTGDVFIGSAVVNVISQNFVFETNAVTDASRVLIEEMVDIFRGYLVSMEAYGGIEPTPSNSMIVVKIDCSQDDIRITYNTDESYELRITQELGEVVRVSITAPTAFGVRHALETLSQLAAWDDLAGSVVLVNEVFVSDRPFYRHRGLMVDTSRNFIQLGDLYRTVDGMSYNKLNTLHLHLTDAHSFPFDSPSVPQMAVYGAYSERKKYTVTDLKALNEYANTRGIRIVPELDGPAHSAYGWQWGPDYGLGDLALCVNRLNRTNVCIGPPCGIQNPVNENTYGVLELLFSDLKEAFSPDVFHLGADEVKFGCWNITEEIVDWLEDQGRGREEVDFYYLWGYYQNRTLEKVDTVYGNIPVIVWTSSLTEENFVENVITPERYIVQIWTESSEPSIASLYNKGYDLIFSNSDNWYLDCGYGSWVGDGNNWCSPYKGWQLLYDNDPLEILANQGILNPDPQRIWGGEAAMWTEQTDGGTLDGKLWPRGSAIAERLWSNPPGKWRTAEKRLVHMREVLCLRGIGADPVQPHWCHQNEGVCYYE
ncbi:chitooligosaccharidolytic beta-N-acetylglucosaminidase-like isoform X2 [Artemia franciscana]|uniref:Beta-hexosaminidase n=1 Tax=Artemia franciscana TaxID=6661 RepID=A0AA88LFE8_ARTSF|nr:hypothetical protein QYM36_001262 [Artemia franciscana]